LNGSPIPQSLPARKALGPLIGESKLSFASPQRLMERLGVEPGAVTLLGLVNDTNHKVDLIFDKVLWEADALQCHPLVNTATLVISHAGIEKFLKETGHEPHILDVPGRA